RLAAHHELQLIARADILPTADLAQRAQHRLELRKTLFNYRVLTPCVGRWPVGDHDAAGWFMGAVQAAPRSELPEQLPDFLGDERDHRMQQSQQRVERVSQVTLRDGA